MTSLISRLSVVVARLKQPRKSAPIRFIRWSAVSLEDHRATIGKLDRSAATPVPPGKYESNTCDNGHPLLEVEETYWVLPGHGGGNRYIVCFDCMKVYHRQTLWRS
jgi:hypothetical protein